MRQLLKVLGASLVTAVLSCSKHGAHGHERGHDHAAESAAHEAEPATLAITRWTERYELFVELPVPVAGKPVPYHAHVTRLSDFAAVTEGTLEVRFKTPTGVAVEATQTGVKRPGIFVFASPAPGQGSYTLEMVYELGGQSDSFDCGTVLVANKAAAPAQEAGDGITFLKESQWKIPFGTAWAEERLMAKELELAATVEPAGEAQLTLAAPVGGRFFHNTKLSLAEGARIKKGDVIGHIAPTVAGDDYSRLQFAVEEARLTVEQTRRELARVEPLVQQGLLPERRLIEVRNELESQQARLKSAGGRLGRVDAPGGAGGLPIKSTLEGLISEVASPNGEPVAAGAPLVRIGGTEHLWVRARFVAKPASSLAGAAPTSLRLASGARIALEPLGAKFASALPVVDPNSRVATWIVDVPTRKASEPSAAALPDLRPGSSVVLAVRFGAPALALAVPRAAVVEINTRPYVFVQTDGEHFERRAVTPGQPDGDFIRIESGLKQGERVVTRGGFDIHLAALMGTVESHRH
jgi:RND family efflux transporter MFP subunit